MGVIKDNKKFKIKKVQSNPTNPTGNVKVENKAFDIDSKTIKEKQSKE